MLNHREANAKAEAILREARAEWPRNRPLINLLPFYRRFCPELKRFDEAEAFAIVQAANRAIVARPGFNMLFRMVMGALIGYCFYRYPALMWLAVPIALGGMCFDFWRVRRQIAVLCARLLPEAIT
jgi:hypothetical protein